MKMRLKRGLSRVLETLLLVLCAATLLFFILRSWRNSRDAAQNTETGVETEDLSVVTSLSCNNGTETLRFTLGEDGKWHWIEEDFPVDQDAVNGLVEALTSFTPTVTAASGETVDLAGYELDSPACEVSYTTLGGDTTSLQFGKDADNGGAYVKYADDDSTVYLAGASLLAQIRQELSDYCAPPAFPDLSLENMQRIALTAGETSAVYTAREQKGETRWSLSGRDVTDDAVFTAAAQQLSALRFSDCLVWNPLKQSLAICGLDEPQATLEIAYRDAAGRDCTLTLSIGDARDDETHFARWSGCDAIFTMDSTAVTDLLALAEKN